MYERTVQFEIVGRTPLLMHWDNLEWADQLEEERTTLAEEDKKASKRGDDRSPPHTWKGSVYTDGQLVALPTDNIRSCLMAAGAQVILSGKTTYKKLTQSGLMFATMHLPLHIGNPSHVVSKADIDAIDGTFAEHARKARALGFQLDCRRATIGQSKHVRVRPRFEQWQAAGELLVTDEQIRPATLQKIFELAGRKIGIGDWRPSAPKSPGQFGMFAVTLKDAG